MEQINVDTVKLEHLVGAVKNEVDKTIADIIFEAEQAKKEILLEAEQEASALAGKRLEEGEKLLSTKYVRVVAKAELDSKRDVLLFREQLCKKVFENIAASLVEFRETPEYISYLERQLSGEKIDSETVICLREGDICRADELKHITGIECSFKADPGIRLGGLSLFYPKRGVLIDKTMDTALSDERGKFILN